MAAQLQAGGQQTDAHGSMQHAVCSMLLHNLHKLIGAHVCVLCSHLWYYSTNQELCKDTAARGLLLLLLVTARVLQQLPHCLQHTAAKQRSAVAVLLLLW